MGYAFPNRQSHFSCITLILSSISITFKITCVLLSSNDIFDSFIGPVVAEYNALMIVSSRCCVPAIPTFQRAEVISASAQHTLPSPSSPSSLTSDSTTLPRIDFEHPVFFSPQDSSLRPSLLALSVHLQFIFNISPRHLFNYNYYVWYSLHFIYGCESHLIRPKIHLRHPYNIRQSIPCIGIVFENGWVIFVSQFIWPSLIRPYDK